MGLIACDAKKSSFHLSEALSDINVLVCVGYDFQFDRDFMFDRDFISQGALQTV